MLNRLLLAALLVGALAACGDTAPPAVGNPPTQQPEEMPGQPEEQPEQSAEEIGGRWTIDAQNTADGTKFDFVIDFTTEEGTEDIAVTGVAYSSSDPDVSGTPAGSVSGTLSDDALTFRMTFTEAFGGGYWDIYASVNGSTFTGSYLTVNSDVGTFNGSKVTTE